MRTYSIIDLVQTLGISRTTLLYYESLGIVTPVQDEQTGYRSYTDDDVFRLMDAMLLKNVGVPPRDLTTYLDDSPFSDDHFAEYLASIDRSRERLEAQRVCMNRLADLRKLVGTITVEDIDPYYISYDSAEQGYHRFGDDEVLAAIFANIPIGCMGAMFSGEGARYMASSRWGRTVATSHAHLIDGLETEGLGIIGGCRCVTLCYFLPDPFDFQDEPRYDAKIQAFLDAHALRACDDAFSPYSLPSNHGFYVKVCVPIVPVDR